MRIMTWRRSKSATIRLARKHEVYGFFSRKGIGSIEKMKSIQAPVETIEAEVFGKPVFKLIFALGVLAVKGTGGEERTVSRLWMYFTCGSMASCSSSGRAFPPARPGPDTRDIFE